MSEHISDAQGRGMNDPSFDPRDIITPHAFEVDESLLNTPLAAPWRRLVALLLDLAIAGFIANVAGGLVGVAVAYVFYRVATRTELDTRWKRWGRGVLVAIGTAILFGLSISFVQNVEEWGVTGPSLSALLPGTSPDTTAVAASSDGPDEADSVEALAEVPSGAPEDDKMSTDSLSEREARLLRRYIQARVARDSAALDTLIKPAQMLVAGPRIKALTARSEAFEDRNDELEEKTEDLRAQVQSPSLWRMGRAMINDLDFTLGWVGLYFTLFLALWNGRTPGKYLLGIRVVRLNGEPLGLWFAFERFGGYAAGIATGMLGFAQLYWDPNRQAIHDRVARTVVISTRSS